MAGIQEGGVLGDELLVIWQRDVQVLLSEIWSLFLAT